MPLKALTDKRLNAIIDEYPEEHRFTAKDVLSIFIDKHGARSAPMTMYIGQRLKTNPSVIRVTQKGVYMKL